uniref:Uncharacterized protein n=1 Tax=Micrurus surinamensis TaxID=129470 RepID=A0A2D4NQD1_MICSU
MYTRTFWKFPFGYFLIISNMVLCLPFWIYLYQTLLYLFGKIDTHHRAGVSKRKPCDLDPDLACRVLRSTLWAFLGNSGPARGVSASENGSGMSAHSPPRFCFQLRWPAILCQ